MLAVISDYLENMCVLMLLAIQDVSIRGTVNVKIIVALSVSKRCTKSVNCNIMLEFVQCFKNIKTLFSSHGCVILFKGNKPIKSKNFLKKSRKSRAITNKKCAVHR